MTFTELTFGPKVHGFGVQAKHTFQNGYGVSVIRGPYSYGGENGLYELAVIGPDHKLDYTTPVTSDVEGHLSEDDVTRLLTAVEALPAKEVVTP